jgi:hypothetical protein
MKLIPGVYVHYKGDQYIALGLARHHESGRPYVIYTPLVPHGDRTTLTLNIRPLTGSDDDQDGWLDPVEYETGGPQGTQMIERFKP